MTWAQIIDGLAVNVVTTDPKECFAEEWLESHPPFIIVPDGTLHGAKDNGDGSFTNPSGVIPTAPLLLSATSFQDVCETALGVGATGQARFGAVIRAMAASADDQVFAAYQRFFKSITFDKAKVGLMLALLVSKGLMTAQERLGILSGWPEV